MPAAWAAVLQPDEAAAEPVASPRLQQAEALAAAVVRRPVALGARPGAVAAGGSLAAAAAVAAGSPAAAVPVAAPAARRTAVAPPLAACGWRCRAAVREDGPAGDLRQETAACRVQQPDWERQPVALLVALPAASGWLCQEAARHPADGASLAWADPATVARCSARSRLEQCWE
jgi:hypothetical protein